MYIPHEITPETLTLVVDNNIVTIPRSALNFNQVRDALMEQNYEAIPDMLDTKSTLETISEGLVSCDGNSVTYNSEPVNNSATKKLLNLMSKGYSDVKPWLKFIEKLMRNPSHNSREQAYAFMEHNGMPLTQDGNIIGYKGVTSDFKDRYTGKIDNTPGMRPRMDRRDVDDNINHGCSKGLHVGTHAYADAWAGPNGKLVLVEFNPEHIVSVPHDCEYAKLRVSEYLVKAECTDRKILADNGVYGNQTNQYGSAEHICSTIDEIQTSKGTFQDIQNIYQGISTSDIIDAYDSIGEIAPDFVYNDELNTLVFKDVDYNTPVNRVQEYEHN